MVDMTAFDETLHPRGQATNAGQFREKTNSAPSGSLTVADAEARPTCPRHGGELGDDLQCEACVDVSGALCPVAADFGELAADAAAHRAEIARWGQNSVQIGSRTPWGAADSVTEVAPGIDTVGTSGHGGVKLSPGRNKMIPLPLRNSSGWYEEDCEINIPLRYFPAEFAALPHKRDRWTPESLQADSDQSIKDRFPDKWEVANGRELEPGESRQKDILIWAKAHETDFVVTSARKAESDPDLVRVTARRKSDGAEGEYLIPKAEYESRRDGDRGRDGRFAVDLTRHAQLPPAPKAAPELAPTLHKVALPGLHEFMADPVMTRAANERVWGDLGKRWKLRDGRTRTLRELVEEDGVEGLSAWTDRARLQYSVSIPSGSIPISKATWDYLSRSLPDTRSEWHAAQQAYSVALSKLEAETQGGDYELWRDEKAKARAAKLAAEATRLRQISQEAYARHEAARKAAEPTPEQLKADLLARERAATLPA